MNADGEGDKLRQELEIKNIKTSIATIFIECMNQVKQKHL